MTLNALKIFDNSDNSDDSDDSDNSDESVLGVNSKSVNTLMQVN